MLTNCPLGNKATHDCWECLYGKMRTLDGRYIMGYDCTHPNYKKAVNTECQTGLREEIKTDCFINNELANEQGWYRKFFYCRTCGLEIKHETWDAQKNHMFGNSSILKDNRTPNFCPNCGTRTDG